MTPADCLDFTSNDYLGLARAGVSRETWDRLTGIPSGSGASRLIHGTHPHHLALEHALASWLGTESTLLFSSGYAANVGVLSSLPQDGDLIVSDALNHASIIDGCRLSRARTVVVPHLDLDALARALAQPARRRWLVTESYFSMDGDTPDLEAIAALARAHDASLIVDEAHALGVFGPHGAGLCAQAAVRPDVLIGTLGKAFGLHGAFVAGSATLRTYLWNRARSFVYSTAPLPLLAALATTHLALVRDAAPQRLQLAEASARLRKELRDAALSVPTASHGPILPLLLGDNRRTLAAAADLAALGLRVQPIRPPTVPAGTARLRITLSATHTPGDLHRLTTALLRTCAR